MGLGGWRAAGGWDGMKAGPDLARHGRPPLHPDRPAGSCAGLRLPIAAARPAPPPAHPPPPRAPQEYERCLKYIFPACSKVVGRHVGQTFAIMDVKVRGWCTALSVGTVRLACTCERQCGLLPSRGPPAHPLAPPGARRAWG